MYSSPDANLSYQQDKQIFFSEGLHSEGIFIEVSSLD